MSPVITYDKGFGSSRLYHETFVSLISTETIKVVPNVFGYAFSNRRARSLSTIRLVIFVISFSIAGLENVRHSFDGRWKGSLSGPSLKGNPIPLARTVYLGQ